MTKLTMAILFGCICWATSNACVASPLWADGPYNWKQGQASVTMKSSSDSVCVLTGVQGKFRGGGEYVRVVIGSDGNWRIDGHSQQEGVTAQAYCFPKESFLANGTTRWISQEFVVSDGTSGCNGKSVSTWFGDAATMLSGIKGELRGGGEQAIVSQSEGGFTSSAVFAKACTDYLEVRAYSFFAGSPNVGRLAKFWGNEYIASFAANEHVDNPIREIKMAPVGDTMCYLTYISGQLDGGGERVYITHHPSNGVDYWYLGVQSGWNNGRKYIKGKARCYKRNQKG